MSKSKIAIFGASKLGTIAYAYLADKHDIIMFIDNDMKKQGTSLCDVPIVSLGAAQTDNIDKIIIASTFRKEITAQLCEAGIYNFAQFHITIDNSYPTDIQVPLLDIGDLLFSTPDALHFEDVTFATGGSGILDYALLKALIEKFGVQTYFEIGTWRGESLAAIANVTRECFSVSLPDDAITHMDTVGIGRPNIGFSRYFSKRLANITHFLEDSKTFDISRIPQDIEMVFIDGDHSFEGIACDTQKVFSHIDTDNCIVVWHDFKTKDNQLRAITLDAIKSVLSEELFANVFGVSNSMCGIYLPKTKQAQLKFGISSAQMYSYKVALTPQRNTL